VAGYHGVGNRRGSEILPIRIRERPRIVRTDCSRQAAAVAALCHPLRAPPCDFRKQRRVLSSFANRDSRMQGRWQLSLPRSSARRPSRRSRSRPQIGSRNWASFITKLMSGPSGRLVIHIGDQAQALRRHGRRPPSPWISATIPNWDNPIPTLITGYRNGSFFFNGPRFRNAENPLRHSHDRSALQSLPRGRPQGERDDAGPTWQRRWQNHNPLSPNMRNRRATN